ncbi:MAG: LUD domain-containing protein [Nitrososphaerota archaeon]|nr:LUD domain-containing protein [Nitrososphaerota archaeon]
MSRAETFIEAFKSRKGEAAYVATRDDTAAALTKAAKERGATRIAVAGLPASVKLTVVGAFKGAEVVDVDALEGAGAKQAVERAQVGVTWAAYAMAKEGTLMEATWDDAVKLASCLPLTNVVLVSGENILPDFAAGMKKAGSLVSLAQKKPTISFISGPSRTADIESRILYGVHGPHSVLALVLGWA